MEDRMVKKADIIKINRKKSFLKGRLFEIIIKEFVKKAGFEVDKEKIDLEQFTFSKKRMKGRGGTYSPDLVGLFKLPVPLTYRLLLLGETKYYSKKIDIKTTRSFLGAYIDLSQYPRLKFTKNLQKYEQIFNERYNYLPVLFSSKGFQKNSQALMYVHGIYFISYENSTFLNEINKKIETLFKKINYSNLNEKTIFSIHKLEDIGQYIKSEDKKYLDNLIRVVYNTNSYFGVLDKKWPINFLGRKLIRPSFKVKKSYIELKNDSYILVKNNEKPSSVKLGGFSLPTFFLKYYVNYAKKNNIAILKDLVLFVEKDEKIYPVYIEFEENSSKKIIDNFNKPEEKIKNA